MQKIIYIVAFFFSICFFSQNKRIVYEISHTKNKVTHVQSFNLDIKDSISYFYESDLNSANPNTIGTKLKIKKNLNNHKIIYFNDLGDKKNFFIENAEFHWKILPDIITINNYVCQKAEIEINNKKWNAYFTSEIPINDGPFIFSKLPGLIVKVESADLDYKMVLNEIKPIVNTFMINRSLYSEVTRDIFFKEKKLDDYKSALKIEYSNNVMTENGRKLFQEYIDKSIENNVLIDLE